MMKIYNEIVDCTLEVLDSIAREPAMWGLTALAAALLLHAVYIAGVAEGRLGL